MRQLVPDVTTEAATTTQDSEQLVFLMSQLSQPLQHKTVKQLVFLMSQLRQPLQQKTVKQLHVTSQTLQHKQ